MSLILDSLKKIKSGNSSKGSVPPILMNLSPAKNSKPNKLLIILLAVAALGLVALIFIPSGSDNNVGPQVSNVSIAPQTKEIQQTETPPAPPAPAQTPQPAPQQDQNAAPEPFQVPEAKNATPQLPVESNVAQAQERHAEAMKGLPDLPAAPAQTPQPAPAPTKSTEIPEKLKQAMIEDGLPLPGQNQPQGQAMAQPSGPTEIVIKSNPANVLQGRAKQEYIAKIDYNTKLYEADQNMKSGNYRKAEQLYSQLIQEKQSKYVLNNLLKAMTHNGRVSDVSYVARLHRKSIDADSVSDVALEMNKAGYSDKALAFLSDFSGIPGSGTIYYTAGVIQDSKHNYRLAETAYAKALKLAPSEQYFVYAAARNKDILNKYSEAAELYKQTVVLDTDTSVTKMARDRYNVIAAYLDSQKEEENK